MKRTRWLHLTVVTLACGLLSPAVLAQERNTGQREDQQQQRAGDEQARSEEANREGEKREVRQLKAIDLKHREPQQIQQILALKAQGFNRGAFGQPQAFGGTTVPPAQQPPGAPARLAPGQTTPPAQTAAISAAQDKDQKQPPAIAVDAENKVLFVRGTEDQIKEVEELVAAFDKPNEELEKHEFGDTRLIPVSQEQSQRIRATLGQLQLQHQMISLGDVSLIAISSGDSDDEKSEAEQVEQVVAKLQGQKKGANDSADGDEVRTGAAEDLQKKKK